MFFFKDKGDGSHMGGSLNDLLLSELEGNHIIGDTLL
jgi:hypothetical protein